MLRISRLRSVIVVSLVAASAALPITASATHSWGGYHWARTSNPFMLKLGDNLSGVWDTPFILATTSWDWSQSTVLDTTIVPGSANPKNCRAIAGRVEICNSKYGSTGWLGVAQVWVSGTHITQGTVKVNDTYFNTANYNTTAWRNLVMCQEVGHTLGLDHQDSTFDNPNLGTCMDYTNDPSTNQHPNQHDYDQLATIYTHGDASTTVGQTAFSGMMPPGLSENDFSIPAQWGTKIRVTNRGWTELYELDLGHGHKVFTFVIRAKE